MLPAPAQAIASLELQAPENLHEKSMAAFHPEWKHHPDLALQKNLLPTLLSKSENIAGNLVPITPFDREPLDASDHVALPVRS